MTYVLPPAATVSLSVTGSNDRFPVRRVYCVGRNYVEHAKEMGFSGREAPFFFLKPADAVVPVAAGEGVTIKYPSLTRDFHHEVELVVAIGAAGKNIATTDAAIKTDFFILPCRSDADGSSQHENSHFFV